MFRILCQSRNTTSICSQIKCTIKIRIEFYPHIVLPGREFFIAHLFLITSN